MKRHQGVSAWREHTGREAVQHLPSDDLTPALRDLCGAADHHVHSIRVELVDGLRREMMLRRIRERLDVTVGPDHLRYTRRAALELQGRRRTWNRLRAVAN